MASSIMQDPLNNACDSVKQHCQVLWLKYLESIERGVPQIFIPKAMADEMSSDLITQIAKRMGHLIKFTVAIHYDPAADAYRIGALDQLPNDDGHVKVMEVPYDQSSPNKDTTAQEPQIEDVSTQEDIVAEAESVKGGTPKKLEKIRKPPNMFILYRQDMHPIVKAQHPEAHNNDISVIVGKMWHNETAEVRDKYKERAAEVKSKFMLEHPDWKCSPRKPSEIKKRSVLGDASSSADTSSQTLATETSPTQESTSSDDLANATPELATTDGNLDDNYPALGMAYGVPTSLGPVYKVYDPIKHPREIWTDLEVDQYSESEVSQFPFEDEAKLIGDDVSEAAPTGFNPYIIFCPDLGFF